MTVIEQKAGKEEVGVLCVDSMWMAEGVRNEGKGNKDISYQAREIKWRLVINSNEEE